MQGGVEPTYCMGDDNPLAVLSDQPHMLYTYFKQRFAQARSPRCLTACYLWVLDGLLQHVSDLYTASGATSSIDSSTACVRACCLCDACMPREARVKPRRCCAVTIRIQHGAMAHSFVCCWAALLHQNLLHLLQVTNPPIDPLREGLVMSLAMRLGARGNLLQPGPGAYKQILLDSPVLLESDLEALRTKQDLVSMQARLRRLLPCRLHHCLSTNLVQREFQPT